MRGLQEVPIKRLPKLKITKGRNQRGVKIKNKNFGIDNSNNFGYGERPKTIFDGLIARLPWK